MTLSEKPTMLLDRVADGDQDAMRALIKRYSGLVWSLVRRKISSQNDAEDLVQEIFSDVWKSAKRFDPSIASETTFVSMIARRRIVDYIRRATRRPSQAPFDGTAEHAAHATTQSPSDAGQVHQESQQVLRVLQSLRPERRQTIELSVIQGLSHSQIAESTGMPLGTVKAHLRRGLEEVRQVLHSQLSAESSKEVFR